MAPHGANVNAHSKLHYCILSTVQKSSIRELPKQNSGTNLAKHDSTASSGEQKEAVGVAELFEVSREALALARDR